MPQGPAADQTETRAKATRPIGVFDSGVGGLSILRSLHTHLGDEDYWFLADSRYAPYGERSEAEIRQRAVAVVDWLRRHADIKALVIACNTATAVAADDLRRMHPDLPIVGIEPALKPAAAITQTGRVGVLATPATLASQRFARLLERQSPTVEYLLQPCPGLAAAIERDDRAGIDEQCARHVQSLQAQSGAGSTIDTVVLGCTHYPFAAAVLADLLGPSVRLLDTGEPVARQTLSLLEQHGLRHPGPAAAQERSTPVRQGSTRLWTTGDPQHLSAAARQWLGMTTATAQSAQIEDSPVTTRQ
ncbi:glutamate racemase [Tibeticola sediminis]|uniref:Glutamate racemase n=1 Tax=Tibeticola sediminis TaxID=1917811 RepID=A0A3N4UIS2_9BURK|nr:glutamate racemase [Tibeticola sediminis]RPE70586.1 glutamate racemase [Tibeticola sediminis]